MKVSVAVLNVVTTTMLESLSVNDKLGVFTFANDTREEAAKILITMMNKMVVNIDEKVEDVKSE